MCVSIFSGINVPLFFMISGATLIDKEEPLKSLYLKRVLKIVLVLFAFSLFYYLWHINWHIRLFYVRDLFTKVVSEGVIIPYWYLYAYIAFFDMSSFFTEDD